MRKMSWDSAYLAPKEWVDFYKMWRFCVCCNESLKDPEY